ncbi:hypothetical protein M0812_02003 [Anaeramoeba flamelloides]|uniref:Uncharacterized protein n=1 Tax=Anaeramoeba flamelloides TaxID=1746091 RepID=A0AAV7YZD6_9EUKA|nr:hypothetical protein M0812_02003 [Anaeramoeba flamelloides]
MTFQFKKLNKKKKQTILLDTNSIRKRNNQRIDRRKSTTLRNIEGFSFKRKRISDQIEIPNTKDFLENEPDFIQPKNKKNSKTEHFENIKLKKNNQKTFRMNFLQNNLSVSPKKFEQEQEQEQEQNFHKNNSLSHYNDLGFEIYQENFEEDQNCESDSSFEIVIDSETEPLMMNSSNDSSNDSSIENFSFLPKSKPNKMPENISFNGKNNVKKNKIKNKNKKMNKNKNKNKNTIKNKYNNNHIFINNNSNSQLSIQKESEKTFVSLDNEECAFKLIKKIQQKERKHLKKSLPKNNQFSNFVFDIFNTAIEEVKETLESDFIDQNLKQLQEIQSQSLNSIGIFLDSLSIAGKKIENDQNEINKNLVGLQESFKENLFEDFSEVKNPQKLISSLIY